MSMLQKLIQQYNNITLTGTIVHNEYFYLYYFKYILFPIFLICFYLIKFGIRAFARNGVFSLIQLY